MTFSETTETAMIGVKIGRNVNIVKITLTTLLQFTSAGIALCVGIKPCGKHDGRLKSIIALNTIIIIQLAQVKLGNNPGHKTTFGIGWNEIIQRITE